MREDAHATYQLQFSRQDVPHLAQRKQGQPDNIRNLPGEQYTGKHCSTKSHATGASNLPLDKRDSGAASPSRYRDEVNSTLTMQNILRANGQAPMSLAQST